MANLKPYSSARDEFSGQAHTFLDANENAYGPVVDEGYHRYPDPLQVELKEKIGKLKGISPDHIFLGNGSDEPIDLLIRLFCEPLQDAILITPPTYGMYSVSANINNVAIVEAPLLEGFSLFAERVLQESTSATKIIFLCSPNNPSGNLQPQKEIDRILENFLGIVVLDEAYIDFASAPSWVERIAEYPNLVVLQTFSKAWGLAGLRLGMAFAHPDLITYLNKIKPPYNLNTLTQQKGLEALEHQEKMKASVQKIIENRKGLEIKLAKLPFVEKVHPSEANFLLVKMKAPHECYQFLVREGIIVRDRSTVRFCEGGLRITIGTAKENARLIEALGKFN